MSKKAKHVVEFRIYELPFDFPVLLLDGETWRISDVMSNSLHFHNCFELGICHSDSGTLVFDNERLPFRAGDITCIPRHITHTTCSAKNTRSLWTYVFVELEEMLRDFAPGQAELHDQYRLVNYHLLNRDQYPRIHFLATSIVDELRQQRKDFMTVVRSLFLLLYYELFRLQNDDPSALNRDPPAAFVLQPALEYIHRHYVNPITITQLAEMCHMSATHFRRTFLNIMGTSPLKFINNARIDQACVLLATSDESILGIAEAVGFSSISSFNRCFLQVMGVSPKSFRNPSVRKSITPYKKYILNYKGWMKPDLMPEFSDEDES